jgi:hypothetical protein
MSNPRYPEEFKIQAVNQVTEKKLPVADVAARLGVSTHSLYAWIKRYSKPQPYPPANIQACLSKNLPIFAIGPGAFLCVSSKILKGMALRVK